VWQDKGGASADGSSDVASAVASAPGLIGCFELPFAVGGKISTVRAHGHPAVLSSSVTSRAASRAGRPTPMRVAEAEPVQSP
jgi:ABC-type phosphate transport system substrate-binding protein